MRTSAESGSPCAPGAEDGQLVVGDLLVLLWRHEHSRRDVQIAELLGDLDVLEHRTPHDEAAPAARPGGVDRLLQPRDVGRERRHQDPALGAGEDRREALADRALARRRPLLLGVGAVAEQEQHALVADAREPGEVGRLTLHRRAVDLEVARVDDRAGRCAHHERACVGDGVRRVHPLDLEAAERARLTGTHRVQLGRFDEAVLAQLVAQKPEGQRGSIDGHREAGQHVRQRADVILMPVGQDDAPDAADAVLQPADVRDHEVDAEHLLLRKHQPGVDDHDVVAVRDRHHVSPDLAKPSQGDDGQLSGPGRVGRKEVHLVAARSARDRAHLGSRGPTGSSSPGGFGVIEVPAHASHVGLQRLPESRVVERGRGVVQGHEDTIVAAQTLTVETRDAAGARQQPGQRVTAEQQDDVGLEQLDLLIEEVAARIDLERLGIAVARRPALDDVGDVDVAPVEPGRFEQRGEQASGRPDERLALPVLVLTGRLAHGHDPRRHGPVAGHRLGAREVQRARRALPNPSVKLEDLLGGRHHCRILVPLRGPA